MQPARHDSLVMCRVYKQRVLHAISELIECSLMPAYLLNLGTMLSILRLNIYANSALSHGLNSIVAVNSSIGEYPTLATFNSRI